MKICIAGAGLSGSILYYLLNKEGYNLDIYDPSVVRGCKSLNLVFQDKQEVSLFKKVIKSLNIDLDEFIIDILDNIYINNIETNKKVYIINKTKIVEKLLPRTLVINRNFSIINKKLCAKVDELGNLIKEYKNEDIGKCYSLLIDASGNSKILQNNNTSYDIKTYQFIIGSGKRIDGFLMDDIKLYKSKPLLGYFWISPIEDYKYHVGIRAYNMNYTNMKSMLIEYIKTTFGNDYEILCYCHNTINGNLMSESRIGGIYEGRTIASVGEAAGLTSILGFGNAYAFISPYILAKFITKNDLEIGIKKYKEYLTKKFEYLDIEKKYLKSSNPIYIPKVLKKRLNLPIVDGIKMFMRANISF
ncbi:NAD(P)/FAD-dependent oxidoreductase [Methanocaldococcus sp.]